MKTFIALFISLFLTVFFISADVKAQGSVLKFNRVMIIDNNLQTVPAGTVWKVTSIYGEEINVCINTVCSDPAHYGKGIISGIYVNNVLIPSTIRGFKANHERYNYSTTCTGSSYSTDLTCANKTADPNILPLWLPEGTTLKSGGPNTFASVIEFIVQ